jgi:hypothetical protein
MAKSRSIHFIHPTMICTQLLDALSVDIKSYDKKTPAPAKTAAIGSPT